jgi:outer membrane protein assembly factor BamB
MEWGGIHDLHVLPSGTIMVQRGASELVEIDPTTKKVIWTYDSRTQNGNAGKAVEIHAFQPLDGGKRIMIAESGTARIIEVDRAGTLLSETPMKIDHPHPHTDTRLVRKVASDRYLVCHEVDGAIREYEQGTGRLVWEYEIPLFGKEKHGGNDFNAFGNKCFGAVRLPNGNTLIGTGNGHSLLEVTPEKKIVWKLEQDDLKKSDGTPIRLAWVTTIEVLKNGHYVVGNCHAGANQPLLIEFDPKTKKVLWTFDQFEKFGNSVPTSQILDSPGAIR